MDRADEPAELVEMVVDDVVGEEKCLEIGVWIGNGGHGEKILLAVLENQRRDRAGRSKIREMLEGEGFGVDSAWIGEPIDIDAQLRERLFEDPCFAIGAFDEHGFVGNAAAEVVDLDLLGWIDTAGLSQVLQELLGLFDIDHEGNGRDARCHTGSGSSSIGGHTRRC